jgi:hypothetical protein
MKWRLVMDENLLKVIRSMSIDELIDLKNYIDMLIAYSKDTNQEIVLFYDILKKKLADENVSYPDYHIMIGKKSFKKKLYDTFSYVKNVFCFDGLDYRIKVKLYGLVADLMILFLKRNNLPLGMDTIFTNIHHLDSELDRAFPGYSKNIINWI